MNEPGIIERLMATKPHTDFPITLDHAISEIRRLRAALKPFADIARELVEVLPDTATNNMMWAVPKVGDFREALRAYEQTDTATGECR